MMFGRSTSVCFLKNLRLSHAHSPELEVLRLALESSTWTCLKFGDESDAPSRRHGHTWTKLGDRVVAFGGLGASHCLQDLQSFEPSSGLWKNSFVSGTFTQCNVPVLLISNFLTSTFCVSRKGEAPSPRSKHTMCALNDSKMILFGGGDDVKLFNYVYVFDSSKIILI